MMVRYFLSSRAEQDVGDIWDHLGSHSPDAADRMVDRFTAAFDQLAQFPESGEKLAHRVQFLRRISVPPYVIYYQFAGGDVCIVRVLHGSRTWEELL